MNCVSCGAPLPAKSNLCRYCQTLNDTDLRALKGPKTQRGPTERRCPRCKDVRLEAVSLGLSTPIEVDRCPTCFGIFFDPGELEEVLEASVKKAYEVDLQRLDTMLREETPGRDYHEVRYVACPDCGELMHRKSYGAKSGVIVDSCRLHGVWLDGGELKRLLEWAKAGGRKHDRRTRERRAEEESRRAKEQEIFRHSRLDVHDSGSSFGTLGGDDDQLPGLLHVIARLIG